MIKNIGVNNTLTKLATLNPSVETSDEVKEMYQSEYKKKTNKQNNFTSIYGKQSNEKKFEIAYLKMTQERIQIKEYQSLGPEFTAMSLYHSNKIF